jgi:hypothetical protein
MLRLRSAVGVAGADRFGSLCAGWRSAARVVRQPD